MKVDERKKKENREEREIKGKQTKREEEEI